jgi:hypothetical protein
MTTSQFDIEGLLELWSVPHPDPESALAAFGEWYADPVVVNGVPVALADLAGRADQVRATFADPRREVLDVCEQPTEDGCTVAVAFRMSGRHVGPLGTAAGPVPPTGQELALRVIDLLVVEGGLITRLWMCADELGALRLTGAVALTGDRARSV